MAAGRSMAGAERICELMPPLRARSRGDRGDAGAVLKLFPVTAIVVGRFFGRRGIRQRWLGPCV